MNPSTESKAETWRRESTPNGWWNIISEVRRANGSLRRSEMVAKVTTPELADAIVADHNAPRDDAALLRVTPAWTLIGRDGESVTLLQKLEQVIEFGVAMEKLSIENYAALGESAALLRVAVEALEKIATPALRLSRGQSATCLRCGMKTYFEKDGEEQHEPDCVQQLAMQTLADMRKED